MNQNDLTPELKEALTHMQAPEISDSFYDNLEVLVEKADKPKSDHKYIKFRYVLPPLTTVAAAIIVLALLSSSTTMNNGGSTNNQVALPPLTTTTSPEVTQDFQPTLASQVIAKAAQTYGSATGVSGTVTDTMYCVHDVKAADGSVLKECDDTHPTITATDFRFNSAGDSWLSLRSTNDPQTQGQPGPYATYIAATNTSTTVSFTDANTGKPSAQPQVQVATGSNPDWNQNDYLFGEFSLSSLLNGLSTDQNAALNDTTYNGIPAWSIHAKGLPIDQFGESPDEVTAVFAKSTLFPLSINAMRNGAQWETTTVSNLVVNPAFKASDFTLSNTTGQKVTTSVDQNPWTVLANTDAIAKAVSYKPLMPTWVPDGYEVSTVLVAKDAGSSGAEGGNSYNKDVVNITYRRGLQKLVFTTRLVGPDPKSWEDPYSLEGQNNSKNPTFKVVGGAYNDTTAHLEVGFGVTPHVWIVGATLVTTINGDASAAELEHMLDSTQRQ